MTLNIVLIGLSADGLDPNSGIDPRKEYLEPYEFGSWALSSHYPAISKLTQEYQLKGIRSSSHESALKTLSKISRTKDLKAFGSDEEILNDDEINAVLVSVKVPSHYSAVKPFLKTKSSLIVEWPLAKNLKEAQLIYDQVPDISKTLIVLQSRKSKVFLKAKEIISNGLIGDVLNVSVSGYALRWTDQFPKDVPEYLIDFENGANILTIAVGHVLDALLYAIGSYPKEIFAEVINRYERLPVLDTDGKATGEYLDNTSPDQVRFLATLFNGTKLNVEVSNGSHFADVKPLNIHIHGSIGDLVIDSQAFAFVEMIPLRLRSFINGEEKFHNDDSDPVVEKVQSLLGSFASGLRNDKQGFNVKGYPTFKDALILHDILNKIVKSSDSGKVVHFTEADFE